MITITISDEALVIIAVAVWLGFGAYANVVGRRWMRICCPHVRWEAADTAIWVVFTILGPIPLLILLPEIHRKERQRQ